MRYRPLLLSCECGLVPARFDGVGLTPGHELVIHWWCEGCAKAVYVVKDLASCWRECPTRSDAGCTEAVAEVSYDPEDLEFLHSMRVCLPEDVG